jgi:hypothetical protein
VPSLFDGLPKGDEVLPHLLISLLVLMFVAAPLADLGILSRPLLGIVLVLVVLGGLLAMGRQKPLARIVHTLGLLLLALQLLSALAPSPAVAIANDVAAIAFIGGLCVVLLLGVFGRGRVTLHRILGAIIVYLLIALLFAMLFDLTERLAPGAFQLGILPTPDTAQSSRLFYLSLVTLTSVGFGDMAPVHPVARALVMFEAVLGQVYMTVLLGWLVSLQIAHRPKRRRSAPPPEG